MPPSGGPPPASRRHWAAKALGLEPDASTEQARSALLRRLATAEFVPTPSLYEAVRAFGVASSRATFGREDSARHAQELSLRRDVEQFRDEYWELSPADRRRRW